MLLEIKQQKNGTIVLRAPDDTVYAFDVNDDMDKKQAEKLFSRIGKTILEVLADPQQPELVTKSNHVHQSNVGDQKDQNDGTSEGALRGLLDALVPGVPLSKGLDFLQGMSSDAEETGA